MSLPHLFLYSTLILGTHLLIVPLAKHRPVIFNGRESYSFIIIWASTIASFIHRDYYLLVAAAAIVLYVMRPWVIVGVSVEKVKDALHRAISATRATAATAYSVTIIDDSVHLKIVPLIYHIVLLLPSSTRSSKKARLTMEVFRKFLMNYSIEL